MTIADPILMEMVRGFHHEKTVATMRQLFRSLALLLKIAPLQGLEGR